jgi:hypothetical protein
MLPSCYNAALYTSDRALLAVGDEMPVSNISGHGENPHALVCVLCTVR